MKLKRKLALIAMCGILVSSSVTHSYADGVEGELNNSVVTIGADLTDSQKQKVFDYFGVNKDEVRVIEVNNQDERKYLTGVATESQLGTKTYSCSYVQPTSPGDGLNVKISNLTFLNSSMLSSVLVTLGINNANVLAASIVGPMSGTGALAGVMKAFETASGEELDETKKEIASEELIVTGNIGKDIGKEKAAGLINEIKTEIIKNGTSDATQVAETINNIVNVYNVDLSDEHMDKLKDLMDKIAKEDYDYKEMKKSLNSISKIIDKNLKDLGQSIDRGFITNLLNNIKGFFSNIFDNDNKDLGIIGSTNDSMLGENAIIDATNKDAINLPSNEEVKGFFLKIWDWITGLFNKNNVDSTEVEVNSTGIEEDVIEDEEVGVQVDEIDEDLNNPNELSHQEDNLSENDKSEEVQNIGNYTNVVEENLNASELIEER